MSQVEACPQGVVWGVAYDSTAWVYTGGWGGAHHKPAHSSPAPGSIGPMSDMKYFYIYENQRWNPLSGFSSSGLPTDRCKICSHQRGDLDISTDIPVFFPNVSNEKYTIVSLFSAGSCGQTRLVCTAP